jgi:hypothetical protein
MTTMTTRLRLPCTVLLILVLAGPARAEEFEPVRTHAVIVGVLEWKHGLAGYPKTNRKDQELRDLLVRRGTPPANIALLLDEQATLVKIRDAIGRTARNAAPGSTLILYYAGHGMPGDGSYYFANYDLAPGKLSTTGWNLKELGDTLAREFKGKRVILWADCCYSGGLEKVVERLAEAGIAAVALTSAGPANASTNNWTFTQSIIDGLNGELLIDANRDGHITLDELHAEVREAMKHREGQLHGFKAHGVAGDFVFAKTANPQPKTDNAKFPVGGYVIAPDGGRQRVGRVVAADGDRRVVQFYDYTEKRTVNCPLNDLSVSTGETNRTTAVVDAGTKADAEVEWQGKWYPAKVLKTENGRDFIHYIGFTDTWNEWITRDRIHKSDCEVEWQGDWYSAQVLKTANDKTLIHYIAFDASWDEWVDKDRIRRPDKRPKP